MTTRLYRPDNGTGGNPVPDGGRLLGNAPHFVLALGVLVLGLIQLGGLVQQFATGGLTFDNLLSLSDQVVSGILSGAHSMISGVLALSTALGLFLRSRLAWGVALMILTVNIALWLTTGSGALPLGLYQGLLLGLLVWTRKAFDRTSIAAATIFSFGSIALLLTYGVVGSYLLGAQFTPKITDFGTAFYFSIVTMSTVGYGDIDPVTPTARFYVVSLIVLGITVFATSLSTVLVPLLHNRFRSILHARGKLMKLSGHYVIVSQSALALNTCNELVSRGEKVIFIAASEPANPGSGVQYVIGNANDLDVLRQADCADAKAIMALGEDDANNAFIVLAAKELRPDLKTVVAVNDARNLDRVKRVEPDIVIAPTILGSELLAMAVTGQDPANSDLIGRLFQTGK